MPIPEFEVNKEGFNLEATLSFPDWAAMGGMVEYPRFTHLPQDGAVVIQLDGEERGLGPLSEDERAVAELSLQDVDGLLASLLDETFVRYPALRTEYVSLYNDDETFMLPTASADDLRPLIRPIRIHLHLRTLKGVPYVGVEAQTTWDQGHGLGVLLNGGRVVAHGAADVSWSAWKIDRDIAAQDMAAQDIAASAGPAN